MVAHMQFQSLFDRAILELKQLDLVKDALKFVVASAAGWVWKIAYDRWKARKARRFWRSFLSKELRIVVGRFGEFDEFERSGVIGIGDAIALSELQAFLATIGSTEAKVVYADRVSGDDLKNPLILVGGPDANDVTRQASTLIRTSLRFGDPAKHEIAFRGLSETPPRLYVPVAPTAQQAADDLGLIVRVKNPFDVEKPALIMTGSYGHGTWAAARYVVSPSFLKSDVAKSQSFECLIKTTVVRDTPQQIQVLIARPLG